MAKKNEIKIPLILRFHRLMDAFTKSNDERDFYLDKLEGFLVYVDLDKSEEELKLLETELLKQKDRFCLIPKMTFFEIKKFMEGFVNEKVYDIDTKEKLLDIISSKNSRENFLEFIYDQLTELEKWQQYYLEISRVKVIEWLVSLNIFFVFEEDLELNRNIIEKLKRTFFNNKVSKDIKSARNILCKKAKTYYSTEALNPKPKRGRPPKQIIKTSFEPRFTVDIYNKVPDSMRPFLYIPIILNPSSITFSSKFETEEQLLASLRGTPRMKVDEKLEALSQRLESLKKWSQKFTEEKLKPSFIKPVKKRELKATMKKKEKKISQAIEIFLPKKAEKKKKLKAGEYIGTKKRDFGIKRVHQIKKRKSKKKK